jgi:hypothetical protein
MLPSALPSRVVLIAAAALFAVLVARPHLRARELLANEARAIEALRAPAPPTTVPGYRILRIEGDGLPALLVAEPEAGEGGGVRRFATLDGATIYEMDPIVFRGDPQRPDYERLRRWLAVPEAQRKARDRPAFWHPLTP